MVTRIPQPQFVGSSPSDVVMKAADLGQKYSEMLQQGVQEGMKNYLVNKQLEQNKQIETQRNNTEQQKAQTESDKLKFGLLYQDLQGDLVKNGAMSYVDRKAEWMQLYKFAANGDKDLANSMYEGGAKGLNSISGVEAYRHGMASFAPQEAAQAASPQGGVATPASTPSVPPGSPPLGSTGQVPASAGPNGAPMQFAPDYLNGKMASAGSAIPPQGAQVPTVQAPAASQMTAPAATTGQGGNLSTQSTSYSATQIVKGLPQNPMTAAALSGLSKLAADGSGSDVTSKEQTAIKQVSKPILKVLYDSPETKAYLAAGGDAKYLETAVGKLNDALAQDPELAKFFNTQNVLSDKEAAAYDSFSKSDAQLQIAADKLAAQIEDRDKKLALNAYGLQLRFEEQTNSLAVRSRNLKTNEDRLAWEKDKNALDYAKAMIINYDSQLDKIRSGLPKGSTEDQVIEAANKEFQNPNSAASSSLAAAVDAIVQMKHLDASDVPTVEAQIKAQYFMGIPFMPETSSASSTKIPNVSGALQQPTPTPTPQPKLQPASPSNPAQAGRGSTAQPSVQQKASDDALLNAAR